MDKRELEMKSSAVTLSDMEVFIFPELIYSLVLANIMSERLWRWRDDPWFAGIERMTPYRRVLRVKQFIMDRYAFNLDLETWGLTTKDIELKRFAAFVDPSTLAQSNALFGYEGDKYYFSIDIRTHFGLDQYTAEIIPYWKTETVEAMDAFRFKDGFETGAGECVSLATLYAAACFVVARMPLSAIYLMATPLHSQNFLDIGEGILTNNRRIVTKAMWFNGTQLSAQARRALENERVTLVAHESGCIHALYPEMSMGREPYKRFSRKLRAFLRTELNGEMLGNFLRQEPELQKCYQFRWVSHGHEHYIPVERLFAYEQGSSNRLTDATREKLLDEVDSEELMQNPLPARIVLNDLEAFLNRERIDLESADDVARLRASFTGSCVNARKGLDSLLSFCVTEPRLPDVSTKTPIPYAAPLGLQSDMTREAIIARLEAIRSENVMANMAFYAWRDLSRTEPEPFLLAAVRRNTTSTAAAAERDLGELASFIRALPNESIYDEPYRLAQPDEVWNFGRGDGVERALLLANILRARRPDEALALRFGSGWARLEAVGAVYEFESRKELGTGEWPIP